MSVTLGTSVVSACENKYVGLGPLYCRAEMYAGRVACCPLVSHAEYADGRDRQTDGMTDGRYTFTLRFPLDAVSVYQVSHGH